MTEPADLPVTFVGGCQRTGTSLLQALLCSDEETNPVVAEAEYLRQMVQPYHSGKRVFDYSLVHYFDDEDAFRRFHAAWIGAFLEQVLQRYRPARHLVLKEPHLTRYFPELWELVPGARFVVLVRDPRDTILSMKDVGRRLAAGGSKHFLAGANLEQLIDHFQSFYAGCLGCRDEGFRRRLLFIKYEDLVTTPGPVLDTLRAFTGLALQDTDPGQPWKRTVRPLDEPHARQQAWRTERVGEAVDPGSIGRYTNGLAAGEIDAIDRAFARFCRRFGYQSHGAHV